MSDDPYEGTALEGTGLTEDGFVAPREADFKEFIRNRYEAKTGLSPDWDETEYLGAASAAAAKAQAEQAQMLQDLYESRDPEQAEGIHLESIAAMTGTSRRAPTKGRAMILMEATTGTVIPKGREVRGGGPDGRAMWELSQDVEVGAVIELDGVTGGEDYIIEVGGESEPLTAKNADTVDSLLRVLGNRALTNIDAIVGVEGWDVDNDGEWERLDVRVDPTDPKSVDFSTTSSDSYTVTEGAIEIFEAKEAGEFLAPVGSIDEIAQPVKGWSSITHLQTTPGRGRETDEQLRARRKKELFAQGSGSRAAIRGSLLRLPFVRSAFVEDNVTDQVKEVAGEDIKPHSFICVLWAPPFTDEQKKQIARTIFLNSPTGIPSQGADEAVTVTTGDGVESTVRWKYAEQVQVEITIELDLETGVDERDVKPTIRHEIESYIRNVGVGETVKRSTLFGRLDDIDGVSSITGVLIEGQRSDYSSAQYQVPKFNNLTLTV